MSKKRKSPAEVKMQQEEFLVALFETGQISTAAKQVGMVVTNHYRWMQQDPQYAWRFEKLYEMAVEKGREKWRASLRKPKPVGSKRVAQGTQKRKALLEALEETVVLSDALKQTNTSMASHREWLKRYPEYAAGFQEVYARTTARREEITSERRSRASLKRWERMTPEEREKDREIKRAAWTPEKRAATSEEVSGRFTNPEERNAMSERMKKHWADPEAATKHREALLRGMATPEAKQRHREAMNRPETKERLAAAARANWAKKTDEEKRQAMAKARSTIKGGHAITRLEAKVMQFLVSREIPHLPHYPKCGYVLDFYIPSLALDVECDGEWFHGDHTAEREAERSKVLGQEGITTLRLTTEEIEAGDFSRLEDLLPR